MMDYLLILNTALNALAMGFIFLGAAKAHIFAEDMTIRVGAMLAAFGLMGQVVRNLQFFATGISPADLDLPFWMLKDLGIVVMVFGYAMRGPIGQKLNHKITRKH